MPAQYSLHVKLHNYTRTQKEIYYDNRSLNAFMVMSLYVYSTGFMNYSLPDGL